jgi:hypothetical protein
MRDHETRRVERPLLAPWSDAEIGRSPAEDHCAGALEVVRLESLDLVR